MSRQEPHGLAPQPQGKSSVWVAVAKEDIPEEIVQGMIRYDKYLDIYMAVQNWHMNNSIVESGFDLEASDIRWQTTLN